MTRLAALAAALLLGCAHAPHSVPVSAAPADLAALQGQWAGEYHADNPAGRAGTIYFRLVADDETATGDVLMHVEDRVVDALPRQGDPWENVSWHRLMSITFVRAGGGMVFGELDPYPDPICGSETRTSFTGRIVGDVVSGTYTSVHVEGGATVTGKWHVTRRTASAE